jgi:Tol biopolymer transport system component
MKARIVNIALVLSLCIFILTCKNRSESKIDEYPNELIFAKYYEPYEVDIKPDASGYQLPLDVNDIVNIDKIEKIVDYNSISGLIEQNGFAIVELDPFSDISNEDFISLYRTFGDSNTPAFVSSDTGLYLYHVLFDETLKDIEENIFVPDIKDLTGVLIKDALVQYEQLEGDINEAAKRNVAYLSMAQRLIDPNASIPNLVNKMVANELSKIAAHSGFEPSDIFIYNEDYSQYVPRGHYTQSEPLKRYFKTMMWFGRMSFLLKGLENWGPREEALISVRDAKIQTLQALLLSWSLKNVQVGERTGLSIWNRIYTVRAFYAGPPDDLTPQDYLLAIDEIFGMDCSTGEFDDERKLLALRKRLALLSSSKIYSGTGNIGLTFDDVASESFDNVLDKAKGMRFFGQSFVPDTYMFQQLIYPEVGNYLGNTQELPFTAVSDNMGGYCRGYMRGLDLMAILGSDEALKIMEDEGDTDYERYELRLDELKDKFDAMSVKDWNFNLYWSWLYSMQGLLQELTEGYPEFVHSREWQRRQLNSALSSWTQLRHDTILEVKQNYAPPPPAARLPVPPPPPPPPPGYVEPVPVFWGRLLSLTRMTSKGLGDLGVLRREALQQFIEFQKLLRQILDISGRQLENNPLLPTDKEFFKKLPSRLKSVVGDIDHKDSMTSLVADVFTNSAEEQVVEEAVGEVDLIVAACPMREDYIFLTVGPVLSYYEFKHPMSDRLTDESWKLMLYSSVKPKRPKWYVPMMRLNENSSDMIILTNNLMESGDPCWLKNGKIAFVGTGKDWNRCIYIMNADGRQIKKLTNKPDLYMFPRWSPDETKIAFVTRNKPSNYFDICVMNSDGSEVKTLTDNNTKDSSPSWSPDGKKIIFDSGRYLRRKIFIMNADGSEKKKLTNNNFEDSSPCWSPDGEKIAFVSHRDGNFEIYIMNTDGSEHKRLTDNPAYDGRPRWSPDGEKIAFETLREKNYDICVMNSDGSGLRKLTNNPFSDRFPSWSPDGKKIVFESTIGRSSVFCIMDLDSINN